MHYIKKYLLLISPLVLVLVFGSLYLIESFVNESEFSFRNWIVMSLILSVITLIFYFQRARDVLQRVGLYDSSLEDIKSAQIQRVRSTMKLDYIVQLYDNMKVSKYYEFELVDNKLLLIPKFTIFFRQYSPVVIEQESDINGGFVYTIRPSQKYLNRLPKWPDNLDMVFYFKQTLESAEKLS